MSEIERTDPLTPIGPVVDEAKELDVDAALLGTELRAPVEQVRDFRDDHNATFAEIGEEFESALRGSSAIPSAENDPVSSKFLKVADEMAALADKIFRDEK